MLINKVSSEAQDFCRSCLDVDRRKRYDIQKCLDDPWIREFETPDAPFPEYSISFQVIQCSLPPSLHACTTHLLFLPLALCLSVFL